MTDTCPCCQGSGKGPKGVTCWTCEGTGEVARRAVATNQCLSCGNFHPAGAPCPHQLTWS